MKTNMSGLDRGIRIFVVVPVAVIAAVALGPETWFGVAVLAFALFMLVVSVLGVCPTYLLFGISTEPDARPSHSPTG